MDLTPCMITGMLVLMCLINNSDAKASDYPVPDEQCLYRDLMYGYESSVRPVLNASNAIVVNFRISINQIVDLDERTQVLTTNVFIDQDWKDDNLKWNTDDYNGIKMMRVPAGLVWLPDTYLFNNADDGSTGFIQGVYVVLNSNGSVLWPVPVKLKSSCKVDITYFPFDEQHCILRFGSWIYSGEWIEFQSSLDWVDTDNYIDNSEWELVSIHYEKGLRQYACCPDAHPDLTYILHMRRRTFYYIFNIIVPCIMLSILTLLTFWLPTTSGEKISLGLSVFLAFSMFMLLIAEEVPATSKSVPLIGVYLTTVMTMTSVSVIMSVMVINLYNRGYRAQPAPAWLKKLILNWLCRLLCMKHDIERLAKTIRFEEEEEAKYMCDTHDIAGVYPRRRVPGWTPRPTPRSSPRPSPRSSPRPSLRPSTPDSPSSTGQSSPEPSNNIQSPPDHRTTHLSFPEQKQTEMSSPEQKSILMSSPEQLRTNCISLSPTKQSDIKYSSLSSPENAKCRVWSLSPEFKAQNIAKVPKQNNLLVVNSAQNNNNVHTRLYPYASGDNSYMKYPDLNNGYQKDINLTGELNDMDMSHMDSDDEEPVWRKRDSLLKEQRKELLMKCRQVQLRNQSQPKVTSSPVKLGRLKVSVLAHGGRLSRTGDSLKVPKESSPKILRFRSKHKSKTRKLTAGVKDLHKNPAFDQIPIINTDDGLGDVAQAEKELKDTCNKENALVSRREIVVEWQTMAMVIDRLLFWIFLLATVVAYIVILLIIPWTIKPSNSDDAESVRIFRRS